MYPMVCIIENIWVYKQLGFTSRQDYRNRALRGSRETRVWQKVNIKSLKFPVIKQRSLKRKFLL